MPRSTTGSPLPSVRREDRNGVLVLGVDPGTLSTGYGIVQRRGPTLRLIHCGAIRNAAGISMPLRLRTIHNALRSVIERFHPDEFAIESAFHGRNAQAALKLGHARGVAILAAVEQELPTTEYSPREVKKAVVGSGTASKEQVQFMVRTLLGIARPAMVHDTSDAIAVAICHIHRLVTPTTRHRDWASFVAAHPERVRP